MKAILSFEKKIVILKNKNTSMIIIMCYVTRNIHNGETSTMGISNHNAHKYYEFMLLIKQD